MKTTRFYVMALILMGSIGALTFAAEEKGAEQILLRAGTKGDVSFPHAAHQRVLNDCTVCHTVFPQQPNIIETMKQDGRLKKKQVMEAVCLRCHRQMKNDGLNTGPVSCRECHKPS